MSSWEEEMSWMIDAYETEIWENELSEDQETKDKFIFKL